MNIDKDIKFLKEWLEMSEDDYRNNTRVVKLKLQRVLQAIRRQ
jgi:hypothetical protein